MFYLRLFGICPLSRPVCLQSFLCCRHYRLQHPVPKASGRTGVRRAHQNLKAERLPKLDGGRQCARLNTEHMSTTRKHLAPSNCVTFLIYYTKKLKNYDVTNIVNFTGKRKFSLVWRAGKTVEARRRCIMKCRGLRSIPADADNLIDWCKTQKYCTIKAK